MDVEVEIVSEEFVTVRTGEVPGSGSRSLGTLETRGLVGCVGVLLHV